MPLKLSVDPSQTGVLTLQNALSKRSEASSGSLMSGGHSGVSHLSNPLSSSVRSEHYQHTKHYSTQDCLSPFTLTATLDQAARQVDR